VVAVTTVGIYTVRKVTAGMWTVTSKVSGQTVGTFPNARTACDHAVALVAAAYKARAL
jgi:hypothetical protein